MNKKQNRYMPLLLAVSMAFGIVIGTFFANRFSGNRLNIINSGSNRLNNLLHIIDDQYVDAVNLDSLVDIAIPQILSDLDPHLRLYHGQGCPDSSRRPEGLFLWSRHRVHDP